MDDVGFSCLCSVNVLSFTTCFESELLEVWNFMRTARLKVTAPTSNVPRIKISQWITVFESCTHNLNALTDLDAQLNHVGNRRSFWNFKKTLRDRPF